MAQLRSIGGSGEAAGDDEVSAQVRFSPETGQIWVGEQRMLLVHAEAQASLRKELIDSLGATRTRGLFTRMGFASGVHDAELARKRAQGVADRELFLSGLRLHTIEGMVKVTTVKLELDRAAGHFYGEFTWDDSWEGQWHRHDFGEQCEPVCWTQIGYVCGYTSSFMGRAVWFVETECAASGGKMCRLIGKPLEEWPGDQVAEYDRMLHREPIAEQLIELQTEVAHLRSSIREKEELPGDMVGSSPGFLAAYDLLKQAAGSQIAVLLLGETGVGKELFARTLHDRSPRRGKAFVAINCSAIPVELMEAELFGVERGAFTGALSSRAGRFERADGGTLFLDEIGELPLSAQAKLLRVLQEGELERLGDQKVRKVDVRLVAATNGDLQLLVKEGRFRSDLYYRLNAYQIRIPPLRERKEDVALLARSFLEKTSARSGKKLRGFTDKAKRALLAYPWPGNIRELMNVIERGVILAQAGGRIEVQHLFPSYQEQPGQPVLGAGADPAASESARALCEAVFNGVMTLEQIEGMLLETAVDKARGNLSSASRMLGITRAQLAYRLKRLHEPDEKVDAPAGDKP